MTPGAGILADENREKREEIVSLLQQAYWMEIETVTSATTQRVFGAVHAGRRRAMPTISSTRGSAASAGSRLVPLLPDAPVTTMRMPRTSPRRRRREPASVEN